MTKNNATQRNFALLVKSPFYQRLNPMRKILAKNEFWNCSINDILTVKYYCIF